MHKAVHSAHLLKKLYCHNLIPAAYYECEQSKIAHMQEGKGIHDHCTLTAILE